MNKFRSMIAMLFAAAAATTVQAGDIMEMRPCVDSTGYTSYDSFNREIIPLYTYDSPCEQVCDLYFTVRLISREDNRVVAAGLNKSYWEQRYVGVGNPTYDGIMHPLQIGIVVSGERKWASLVNVQKTPVSAQGESEKRYANNVTDLVFVYHVQPGEFALPIRLAADHKGTPVDESISTSTFLINNSDYWQIFYHYQDGESTDQAVYSFSTKAKGQYDWWQDLIESASEDIPNWYFSKCGLHVKMVDLEKDEQGYLPEVKQNHVQTGYIVQPNGLNITNAATLYVWSEDSSVVEVASGAAGTKLLENVPFEVLDGDKLVTKLYNVLQVTVQGESKIVGNFNYRGITKEKSAKLVLSSFKGYNWQKGYSGAPRLVVDYVTADVNCVPSEPEVYFERIGDETRNIGSEFESPLSGGFSFELTDPYLDGDMTVTITPKLTVDPKPFGFDYKFSDVIRLSEEAKDGWQGDGTVSFTIKKGMVDKRAIYVYGMGAVGDPNVWSDNKKGQKIEFDIKIEPAAASAFVTKVNKSVVYFKPESPVIENADELATRTVREGIATPVGANGIKVTDNYTDMNDTNTAFRVKFLRPGATDDEEPINLTTKDGKYNRFAPDANGALCAIDAAGRMLDSKAANWPCIPGTVKSGVARLWLLAPNAAKSEVLSINITVQPAARVTSSFYETSSAEKSSTSMDEVNVVTGDRKSAWVEIALSEPCDDYPALYAYLEPTDPKMYDIIAGDCLTNSENVVGIPITRGNTVSDERHELYLLDGSKYGTTLRFNVILCSSEIFDPAKIVDTYMSQSVNLKVMNVAPVVHDIEMNGWTLEKRGEEWWMGGTAALGIPQTFSFDIYDAEKDREATGAESFAITYQFTGGKKTTVTGNPKDIKITHKFTSTSETTPQKLTLTFTDKDGGKTDFMVNIEVTDKPRIYITRDEEGREEYGTFFESDKIPFKVWLENNPADIPLNVKLTVTPLSSGDKRGDLQFAGSCQKRTGQDVYDLTFKPGDKPELYIYVDSADGTAGGASKFTVEAEITNTEIYEAADVPWSEYFDKGRFNGPLTVNNVSPSMTIDGRTCRKASEVEDTVIELNTSNSPIDVAIGEAVDKTIYWSVDDVVKDVAGVIKVTFSDQAGSLTYKVSDTTTREYVPRFNTPTPDSPTTVEITATDKDGGSITVRRYYNVKAARMLQLTAVGPSGGSTAAHVQHYRGGGLGEGHVYAAGAVVSSSGMWSFELNCGTKRSVNVTGRGYRSGDVDNGTLNNGNDFAIDTSGKYASSGPYYTYDNANDSFFYCWVRETQEDGGNLQSEIFGAVAPEVKQPSVTTVALPTEQSEEGSFAVTVFDAIFSRELLASDNIGDINADGIPDIYAKAYLFDVFDDTGAVVGNDMKDISNDNNDGDYFPVIFTETYAHFIPNLSNTWVDTGRAFNNRLEIRGWGDQFNDAWQVLKEKNRQGSLAEFTADKRYTNPKDDKTSTLSELEYDAWVQAGKPENWSPERPTNPMSADTDGDGMSDGYEYYIWYKAHVGYMDGETHKYLSGRKYNPLNPYNPIVITPETIAALYDPLTPRGNNWDTQDTDEDGIPDTVEFLTGTNPFDYDSDGDGLPDGYELYISNTDPLMADTNKNGVLDGAENPDRDAMATMLLPMALVEVAGDEGVEYYCCASLENNEVIVDTNAVHTGAVFSVKAGDEIKHYLTVQKWNTYTGDDGQLRLAGDYTSDKTWLCDFTEEGDLYRKEPATVVRGTAVEDYDDKYEYFDQKLKNYEGEWFFGYQYNGGIAKGVKLNADQLTAFSAKAVIGYSLEADIRILHYQVYTQEPYDPNTGWYFEQGCVNSASYTTMDEFLSMVFFYRMGTIQEGDMYRTDTRSWANVWTINSTSPTNADTDNDRMPDGWELYVMAGRGNVAGPNSQYSPMKDFNLIGGDAKDNDADSLDWPNEYSGVTSSGRYGWTPLVPTWRNKAKPTDPWNPDTDNDGVLDGNEGGFGDGWMPAAVASHFMYNSRGRAGGGLNPLAMDTDQDGLPDPWEIEFHGTYSAAGTAEITGNQMTTNNTTQTVASGVTWNMDGMDGTVSDARLDYDGDGLANWQEYMVGAMRCWRYDDNFSCWTLQDAKGQETMPEVGTEEWDQYWYDRLLDDHNVNGKYNPHLVNGYFDPCTYFTRCSNSWDPSYRQYFYFRDGANHAMVQLVAAIAGEAFQGKEPPYNYMTAPKHYISCDPRMPDSDGDGMDDYYELFHGMNPMLGASAVAGSPYEAGATAKPYDIVFDAYARQADKTEVDDTAPSALNNWWINKVTSHLEPTLKNPDLGGYDFLVHPWLNGLANADPDGDYIVNQEESIMPRVQAATTYKHTDPTPLWMTDSAYTNSLTRRYYRTEAMSYDEPIGTLSFEKATATFKDQDGEVHKLSDFDGFEEDEEDEDTVTFTFTFNPFGVDGGWMFNFEENEGYDSDHDFLSDYEEAQGKTKNASDPQNHDDPLRRQAMYFNGVDAFLQQPVEEVEVPVDDTRVYSEERQNFLYYTVECWAKPDAESVEANAGLRTLVERSVWADNASAADEQLMRRNFLIGVMNGRWYTCFDSTGTDLQPVEITDGPIATTNWTHIAATFDGEALKLYVDGICRNTHMTSIRPENGQSAISVNSLGELNETEPFDADCISILIGASAATRNALVYDLAWRNRSYEKITEDNPEGLDLENLVTFKDYGNYYKGYIDEVRIWDGARAAADIQNDYDNRTRYTMELAKENRQAVYNAWKNDASRAPTSTLTLPAQLMYHWSFDQVAGAILPEDVLKVPAGFNTAKNVLNSRATWSRPEDYTERRWETTAVRSTVYTDCAFVPWINNTVAHLPRFDKTTLDSVYWSEDYAGYSAAISNGIASFSFPRTAEVPSRWTQQLYTESNYYDSHRDSVFDYWNNFTDDYDDLPAVTQAGDTRWHTIAGYELDYDRTSEQVLSLRFTLRDRKVVGDDLLPMGGAYPRRISAAEGGMWDNLPGEAPKASDAWAQTGDDADFNGLPEWWEEYARANYCKELDPFEPLKWDTTVDYNGILMPAWQAYLRDLAKGMIKKGGAVLFDENYADTRDNDHDGLPDWWEELYGLDTTVKDADDDPDHDGLSNYQEYVLGELYVQKFADQFKAFGIDISTLRLDPTLTYSMTYQVVPDYFLRYAETHDEFKTGGKSNFFANEYFGEIATDHDFMEDWWENLYDVGYTSARKYDPLADKDGDGWSTWAECRASLWGGYFLANRIDQWIGSTSDQYIPSYPQPIISIKATYFGKQDISGNQLVVRTTSGQTARTDAVFVVPTEVTEQTRYLGAFSGDSVMHGHMSPGLINANSIVFERAIMSADKTYYWNFNAYSNSAFVALLPLSGTFEEYRNLYAKYPKMKLEGADLEWAEFSESIPSSDGASASIYIGTSRFGIVDCTTGEYELDMSKFSGEHGFDQYVFRVTYSSRIGHEWPQTVYLSDTKELVDGSGNGYVREGKNTIEAFIDLDGSGTYTPGEPYGVAQNVDIGWHKTPVTVIELKDTSHVVPRFDVVSGYDDRSVIEGASAAATTQEGEAAEMAETGLAKKISIRRVDINGYAASATEQDIIMAMPKRTLLVKWLTTDSRGYLTEADVLGNAKFDLDSNWLVRDAEEKLGIKGGDIENATYEISEVLTLADGTTSNIVLKTFVNRFNPQRAKASTVSPINNAPVYSSKPTFSFSCSDETMTAYRLQIARRDDGKLVYDSGDGEKGNNLQLLPGRTSYSVGKSVYEVSPSICADARVCAGMVKGGIFANATGYKWRIALYNAKYNTIEKESDWSDWADFELDVANIGRYPLQPTGFGSASVAVRYYGPTNTVASNVWVEAFSSADFRGQPVARATISSIDDLDSYVDAISTNAVLNGIAPGTYYFRAFIDFNQNGQRDDWESWGYANYVGKGVKAIYNPKPFVVTPMTSDFVAGSAADFTIFIEDCDTDQNEYPDCIEKGFYDGTSGTSATDTDGDGIPDTEEETYSTDAQLSDTDNDGMPDGYEAMFAGTDPTLSDADEVIDGDVMAFAKVPATLVVVESKDGADKLTYMVPAGEKVPVRGDDVGGRQFTTTYTYPTCEDGVFTDNLGIGTNATLAAGTKVLKVIEDSEVVLVHSQVYDEYGFNSKTAVPVVDAVNTKPFTALDKYLVVRYLEAIGLANEAEVNKKGLWSEYTLKPYEVDLDKDGIADGWELYVMFGPDGSESVKTLKDAKISPWNYDDARELSPDSIGHPEVGMTPVQEYDEGNSPTDPWNIDTDGDNVIDYYAFRYHLKGDDAGRDFDGDGLSNYTEYLISEVFKFAALDPDNPKTDDSCVDYFRKAGDLYFGEIFTDHDQVDDTWEQTYNMAANRYEYDPSRDDDRDGWSNWAESKVGTNPNVVTSPGIDGNVLPEYPIPAIAAKVIYNGKQAINAPIVFSAWSQKTDPDMTGTPDATWVATGEASTNATKYVGVNPGVTRTYHLGTGVISPGSVRIEFRDMSFEKATIVNGVEINSYPGEAGDARWYYFVQDRGGELFTSVTNQTPVKVGTVDYSTGIVTVDFGCDAMQGIAYDRTVNESGSNTDTGSKIGTQFSNYDKLDLSRSYVRIGWSPVKIDVTGNATYYLSDVSADIASRGHVREGLNKFVVFADTIQANNAYDPGEPFGFVRDVDVGWQGGYFEVELTETSPIFARVNLLAGGAGGNGAATAVASDNPTDAVTESDVIATDRQYWHIGSSTIRKINPDKDTSMDVTPLSDNIKSIRVRVVRTAIDGSDVIGHDASGNPIRLEPAVVMDKTFDLGVRSYLHEGDFLGDGEYDIDWGTDDDNLQLALGATSSKYFAATNVTYTIYLGETVDYQRAGGYSSQTNRVFMYTVDRVYDATVVRTPEIGKAVIMPKIDKNEPGIVHTSRPTFRWKMDNGDGIDHNSYTAFRLQIMKGSSVVYNSGYRLAPGCDVDGYYQWTITDPLESVVGTSGEYTWRVSMYNSKFRDETYWSSASKHEIATWSEAGQLLVDINQQQTMNDNGYSTINAVVKYAGPSQVMSKVDASGCVGKVHLLAYATADFTGNPIGESIVTGVGELTNTAHMVANAAVHGLPQTGTYYLMAYIDSNGNGKRDEFESWGAASESVKIDQTVTTAPTVGIYIEDVDTDHDWIPDALEYALGGWKGDWESVQLVRNGKIAGGDTILFSGDIDTATAGISTGLNGASLTIFKDTQSFIVSALGMSGETVSIDDIRAAVEKQVKDNSVRITALSLSPDGKKVTIAVAAEVTDTLAGKLVSSVYDLTGIGKDTASVKVVVYRKESLTSVEWTKIGTYGVEIGRGDVMVDVDVSGIEMDSGFYRIEIEK